MVNYRRNFVPGGTFFFTVTLQNRKSCLLVNKIELFKESVNKVKALHPFKIKAYVILPDHLHMIWTLPESDANYSKRWKNIKTLFSKSVQKAGIELTKTKHDECRLWQRRFWEHTIKDAQDYENHVHYIHYNPIKHGLVDELNDWPHSSFQYYVQHGYVSKHWASSSWMKCNDELCFGE